jgi:hypothetical protein
VHSVEQARLEARKVLGSVAKGEDPSGERKSKRKEMTVALLVDFCADNGTDHMKGCNKRYMLARLRHHIVPLLGRKNVKCAHQQAQWAITVARPVRGGCLWGENGKTCGLRLAIPVQRLSEMHCA